MDAIGDILQKYKLEEPGDIARIRKYIQDHFDTSSVISIQGDALIISVSSASLAGTLRLRTVELLSLCKDTKQLRFRIS